MFEELKDPENIEIPRDGLEVPLKIRKEQVIVYLSQEVSTRTLAGEDILKDQKKIQELKKEAAQKFGIDLRTASKLYHEEVEKHLGYVMPVVPIIMQSIAKAQANIERIEKDIEQFDTNAKAAAEPEVELGFYRLKHTAIANLDKVVRGQIDTIRKIGGLHLAKRKIEIAQDELNRRKGIYGTAIDTEELNYGDKSKDDLEKMFRERLGSKKHLLEGKKNVDFIDYKNV